MLDGWFCRSRTMASTGEQEQQPSSDDEDKSSEDESNQSLSRLNQKSVDHKAQYQNLKKKLKYLLYVSCDVHFFFYRFFLIIFFCLFRKMNSFKIRLDPVKDVY